MRWIEVRGVSDDDKVQVGKHDWALFLRCSRELSPQKILEIDALRWGIEVYFFDLKQHLGLLKEQTINFASHIASICLTDRSYLTLLYASLEQNKRLCEVRDELSSGLIHLSFGQRLWGLFRQLINDTLKQFRAELGEMADPFRSALEQRINAFFTQALQLDAFTLELEARPDTA